MKYKVPGIEIPKISLSPEKRSGSYEQIRISERNETWEKVTQLIIDLDIKVKCLDVKIKKQ